MRPRVLEYGSVAPKVWAFLVIGLLFGQAALGQNLVLNPSFEEFEGGCYDVDPWELSLWDAPECGGYPAYFTECNNESSSWSGVPYNQGGYEPAHSGQAYNLIHTFAYTEEGGNLGSYLSIDLSEPLVAGQEYCIALWMSLAEQSSFRTSTLHAFLWYGLPTMCNGNDSLWDDYAAVTFNTSEVDTAGWYLIEGTFTASGSESNLTLGSFLYGPEIDTTFLEWHLPPYTASYYVDDVYLGPCDGVGVPLAPSQSLGIFLLTGTVIAGEQLRYSVKGAVEGPIHISIFDVVGHGIVRIPIRDRVGVIATSCMAPGKYVLVVNSSTQFSTTVFSIL